MNQADEIDIRFIFFLQSFSIQYEMINYIITFSLCALICISNPQQQSFNFSSTLSRQYLVEQQNFYVLNFDLTNQLILKSLINLFLSWDVEEIQISMGYRNNKLLNFYVPIDKGIFALVKNNSKLQQNVIDQLGQVFLISRKSSFSIFLSEMNSTYVSNPNDKFCSQHLTNLVKYFLPCRLNSGLAQLLNEKQQFQQKLFGVFIFWNANGVSLKFMIDKEKDTIRKVRGLKNKNGCGIFDQTFFIEQESQVKFKKLQTYLDVKADQFNFVQTFDKSNWYESKKQIIVKINLNSKLGQLQSFKLRYLFPKGFQLFSVSRNIQQEQLLTNIFKIQTQNQEKMIIIEGVLTQKFSQSQIVFNLQLIGSFKGFQNYQNIAGGGQQFMRIPVLFKLKNQQQIWINNDALTQHLLQPDFSIPFQTITFTIVIFGYLWIAIWRSLIEQQFSKHKKQNTTKTKQQ